MKGNFSLQCLLVAWILLTISLALTSCVEHPTHNAQDLVRACEDYCEPNAGKIWGHYGSAACVCEVPGVFLPLSDESEELDQWKTDERVRELRSASESSRVE